MVDHQPPRLSLSTREAIRNRLSGLNRSTAVPISRILSHVRSTIPKLDESDDDLIEQIVMEATGNGFAIHFYMERKKR